MAWNEIIVVIEIQSANENLSTRSDLNVWIA